MSVRRASDEDLFQSIQAGVPGSEMPPFPFPDEDVWNLVAFVRDLSAPAFETARTGDPQKGSALFHGAAGCSNCHRIRGSGGVLGPDLTDVGAQRRLDQLRTAVVSPDDWVPRDYEAVRLRLADGSVVRAVARNRSNHSAQVVDEKAKLHLLRKADLGRLERVEGSWMPGDYGDQLGEGGVNDVLAFLQEQVIRREGP